MRYRLAIFDFDGTLADSFPFFLRVFNQLARQHGFKEIDPEQAAPLRGYTARQMMSHVGLPSWKLPLVAASLIALMRENAAGIKLFAGVSDVLTHLVDSGVRLAIVSSNAYDNVSTILGPDNSKRISHFECGMSIFGKSARIEQVLEQAAVPVTEPSNPCARWPPRKNLTVWRT